MVVGTSFVDDFTSHDVSTCIHETSCRHVVRYNSFFTVRETVQVTRALRDLNYRL